MCIFCAQFCLTKEILHIQSGTFMAYVKWYSLSNKYHESGMHALHDGAAVIPLVGHDEPCSRP